MASCKIYRSNSTWCDAYGKLSEDLGAMLHRRRSSFPSALEISVGVPQRLVSPEMMDYITRDLSLDAAHHPRTHKRIILKCTVYRIASTGEVLETGADLIVTSPHETFGLSYADQGVLQD